MLAGEQPMKFALELALSTDEFLEVLKQIRELFATRRPSYNALETAANPQVPQGAMARFSS